MAAIAKLDDNALQAVCDILGDTAEGLSGSEIARILDRSGINDVEPQITKRHRLFAALKAKQEKDDCSNNIFFFIQNSMDPMLYVQSVGLFETRRTKLNIPLSFLGYELGSDGKIKHTEKINTLDEAQAKAGKLKKHLMDRNIHHEVLKFCKAELIDENYFHAVFEATKSIADRIRTMTGLDGDGSALIEAAFNSSRPKLAINSLQTETEKTEQAGFSNLLKGIFGMFRNTTAHVPKIKWKVTEEDAIELLTLVSFAHRKLDNVVPTRY